MTPQRLIMAAFFLQPLAFGSWLPRIPEVQHALGLDHATLAMALLGLPVGILVTLPFAGPLTARIGGRNAIIYGIAAFLVAIVLPAWAWNVQSLFACLVAAGSAMSIAELGLNIKADEIEKNGGRMIMSTCHGFWSLGVMAGSLVAAGFAAFALTPGISQLAFAVILFIPSMLGTRLLPQDRSGAQDTEKKEKKRLGLPHPILIGICLFTIGITMTEGAAADWSAVFLRDMFGAGPAQAGIGYSVFAMMVAAGRFTGDRVKARFGAVFAARGSALIGLAGVAVIFTASVPAVAVFGFALLGAGASLGFPLAVTAAADAPGGTPAGNVAILSFMALAGFLLGPPMIGFAAQATDIRWGLAVLAPALTVSIVLAGLLSLHARRQAASTAAE